MHSQGQGRGRGSGERGQGVHRGRGRRSRYRGNASGQQGNSGAFTGGRGLNPHQVERAAPNYFGQGQTIPEREDNNREIVKRSWLRCKINGQTVFGMLSTGCTATYMTHKFMEKLNLTRMLNDKITGTAFGMGLGKQTIIGQLAAVPLELSPEISVVLPFFVIENDIYDALYFGCDMIYGLADSMDFVLTKCLRIKHNGKVVEVPLVKYKDEVAPIAESCILGALNTCEIEYEAEDSASGGLPKVL